MRAGAPMLLLCLLAGCVLDWDGTRPGVPGDLAVDTAWEAAPGDGGAPDAAGDTGFQDDAPQLDGPKIDVALAPDLPLTDLLPPDVGVQPDIPQVCAYDYTGHASFGYSAVSTLNSLAAKGWKLEAYVHGVANHTALLQDKTGDYELLEKTDCFLLDKAVNSAIGKGYTLVSLSSNKSNVAWLRKGLTTFLCLDATAAATIAGNVNKEVAAGWQVHSFPHADALHAAWLSQGASPTQYKLSTATTAVTMETAINNDVAAGWKVEALLASTGHTIWLVDGKQYKVINTSNPSTAQSLVNTAVGGSWTVAAFAHSHTPWAAWLVKGGGYSLRTSTFGGYSLEPMVAADVKAGYKPAAFLAHKEYALWISKFCP